jgi:DNA-binding beta-propeller fold protein YncE
MIYVSNHDTILVINGSNDEIINNIKSPRIVKSIVINPLDDFMYISTFFNNSILVIDTKKNKLSTDISIPIRTRDMSIDTKTNSIYMTAEGGSRVFVINGYSKTLLKTIIAGNDSAYEVPKIAVDPNTNRIFVSHPNSDSVSVIDGSRGFISQNPVGKHPSALAVNPNTNMLYVANTESNTLSVINGFMITDDPGQLTARDTWHKSR